MAKIAFLAPLTGPESVVGVPMMQIVALAVEQANQRGQLPFSVELLALDDGADPARARVLAGELVADGDVLGVVGHKNSGPSAAAGATYAAGGLVQITPSSTNSDLARQGWQTFFRVCADNDRQAAAAAAFALDILHARRVAVVHDGTGYGQPLAEAFRAAMQQGGAEISLVEPIRLGQRQFDEPVRRLAAASGDLIYMGLTEIESSYLVRALRAAGVGAHFFGADGGRQSPFPQMAGDAAEGVHETYAGADAQATEQGREFLAAYERRYGDCPIFGAEVYDAACLLLDAVCRAGTPHRSAVVAAVHDSKGYYGVTGSIWFEPDGNRKDAQVTIWQVQNGKMLPATIGRKGRNQ
jgi:branched-chain amino acid transport system substrate-binding protein